MQKDIKEGQEVVIVEVDWDRWVVRLGGSEIMMITSDGKKMKVERNSRGCIMQTANYNT